MCGIAGRILNSHGKVGQDLVDLMDAQEHRGADSTGFAVYGPVRDRGLVLRLMSFFSTNQRRRFYPKNYPLWGGLTNMNLTKLPAEAAAVQPSDYLRCVSTGPVTPLVLSATTFGGHVNLSLSYRTSVFSREDIAAVRARFADGIRSLEAAA